MEEVVIRASRSLNTEPFKVLPPDKHPKDMVIREIDFKIDSGDLKIYISRAWGPIDVSQEGIDKTLDKWLKQNPLPDSNITIYSQPYESELSINNKEDHFIVYILTKKNWQFTQEGAPFTIEIEANKTGCYFEAKRLVKGISEYQGVKPASGLPRDWCRCAYFIAFGSERQRQNPKGYFDNINIYIDLFNNKDGSHTPIIIDPDIRYPGGNTILDDDSGAPMPI